jgi:hypothetical protein
VISVSENFLRYYFAVSTTALLSQATSGVFWGLLFARCSLLTYVNLLTIVNFKSLPIISKFSASLTVSVISTFSSLKLILWATGVLITAWELLLLTCVVSYTKMTNFLSYEYRLWHAAITRTSRIKKQCVLFDSKLHFQNHVDFIFSECIKLLWRIRSITFRLSSLGCLYMLQFALFRSGLEYASVVWNYHVYQCNSLERIQQNFGSFLSIFFPLVFLIVILLPSRN